ncbi:MAG: orotidine 5'-phosphate decarboxylase [Pelatocladus maniniholoensis HA4357-MV3]|jgi:3-hexulose-6-phosphate synthase|uniref:3-hexulose-6-phosphate synthase n=1 Tax=Pelatocladus maniniholoensis HA4357-MV3 TaxID=1117104 RepID=A0A9E3H717_9NOST|nr:orotidine 5'-phosphate decarboxylase [Pelatocladus maniniholoensis HA4357-MV3]BAZ70799.1 3-hexulose-6-phosphate synthase [Fischerella sp. NIES-4106]
MKLQVSVDLLSLEQAIKLLKDVVDYVDIIEAGTPLIKQEGLKVVETFKQSFPNKLIFADMKTMDAGGLEAEMAFKAGADFTTILAVSNDSTIQGAIAAARKYGRYVTADMISVSNRVQRARDLEKLGVNYLELHCGLDEQANHLCASTASELTALRGAVSISLSAAGGINENTIQEVEAAGADVAAVGAAIYNAQSPAESARRLREKINSKVKALK